MFCINLFRLGLNPKAIQKIMGYANTSTTLETYTHMEDKALREQVGELGNNISFAAVSFGADGVQSSNGKGSMIPPVLPVTMPSAAAHFRASTA